MKFIINPFYKTAKSKFTLDSIKTGISLSIKLANQYNSEKNVSNEFELIGVGNSAEGKVYSLNNTLFCLKISKLGKHVGGSQEKQFQLNEQCFQAISNKEVKIENISYQLSTIRTIAVATNDEYAYSLMPRLDDCLRLWDEDNIPFKDKDNWDVISEIKDILRAYARIHAIGEESFVGSMDINGNNLMVDIKNKKIYLIDPYVPEFIESENTLLLDKIIMESWLYNYLEALAKTSLSNWYVVGSAIAQTIWNYKHKFDEKYEIKDIDIIYFDNHDLTAEAEKKIKQEIQHKLPKSDINIHIVNVARLHLCYEQEFGKKISQYKTSEDAIDNWPTTATAIGVRMSTNNELAIYAPFALDDLINLIVRPNKKLINEDVYSKNVEEWTKIWKDLKIIDW